MFGCFRREKQRGGNAELLLLLLTEQGKVTHREEVRQQELGETQPLAAQEAGKANKEQ